MKLIENIDKCTYNDFVKNHYKSHFLQSYEWGEFAKYGKNVVPHYLGLLDNDKLVATSLILEKKLFFGYSYGYSPRGFIIDYNNKQLLRIFIEKIHEYLKQNKIIYLTIDPDIPYQELNSDTSIVKNGYNNYELLEYLKSLHLKHKGFNKLYEGNQPRYTFRINLNNTFNNIENNISKSFLKNVKKSFKYNINVKIGDIQDIETFYKIITKTATRDNFHAYSNEYYKKFYEIFSKANMSKIFIASVNREELLTILSEELSNAKDKSIDRINRIITTINESKEEEIVISTHIIVIYAKKCWALYAGTDDKYKDLFANNRLYYEKIKYAYDNNCEFIDLFGVCGDPNTKYKNLKGIYEFKKQFGGELLEFIGEFDLVNNKLLYKILPLLLKIYHIIKK